MKKIIINGRPLLLKPCGNKNFSINFIKFLALFLKDFLIEILIPSKLEEEFNFPSNCKFNLLPYIKNNLNSLEISIWDNIQIADYINNQKEKVNFFLTTHHAFPLKKLQIPAFVIIHDIQLWQNPDPHWSIYTRFRYEINKHAIVNANLIFTVSEFTRNSVINFFNFPKNKVITIYQDINPELKNNLNKNQSNILKKLGVREKDYLLYIGSLEPRKNISNLIKAYQIYKKNSKNPKQLIIIGSTLSRSTNFNINIPSDIKKIEYVSEEEKICLYKNAFLFIYPSYYEGFGLQILEAQNLQCPIILSDIPAFREIAGKKSVFFNPKNSKDIVKKIITLEQNPNYLKKIIKYGINNAQKYDWKNTIKLFINSINPYLKIK